jgi:hypothetical protein
MGAATSPVLTETFIQYLKHTKIVNILNKCRFIDYHIYVYDILIIYNMSQTENTLTEFNSIYPQLNFPMEKETNNKLYYSDITVTEKTQPTDV